MKNKMIVFGEAGQLGQTIKHHDAINEKFDVVYYNRQNGDITDVVVLNNIFDKEQAQIVVNCAAYTAVDLAEDESEKANAINHLAVENMAKLCNEHNCLFIHISTDYVFDGKAISPIKENNTTGPTSVYGESKLAGELALQQNCRQHYIIRTAWVYSEFGNNFMKTMLRLGSVKNDLNVVSDQQGVPTYTNDIADCIYQLAKKSNTTPAPFGIYNFVNDGSTNWSEFAEYIMQTANLDCKINPITTTEYPTKATRPAYSVLDNNKVKQALNLAIPHWQISASACLSKILSSQS